MKTTLLLVLACSGVAACASDTTMTRHAVRYDDHIDAGNRAADRDIYIQDKVASVCDIPQTASYFSPGASGVEQVDSEAVRRVADCMKDGPLKNEKIVVIGYTDPAGSEAFNARLGLERAQSVATALVVEGIARDRVFIKSYGESKSKDAMSEADWAKDRKVTLRVAQPR